MLDKINALHSNVYGLILIMIGSTLVCLHQHDIGSSLIFGGGVLMNVNLGKSAA